MSIGLTAGCRFDAAIRSKIQQLIIDEITFVISGMIALGAFWHLVPQPPIGIILVGIEWVLLIALGIDMLIYADLAKSR